MSKAIKQYRITKQETNGGDVNYQVSSSTSKYFKWGWISIYTQRNDTLDKAVEQIKLIGLTQPKTDVVVYTIAADAIQPKKLVEDTP